jgi:hypothetical protein
MVGVLSYNGQAFWGFNADSDRLPDLPDFQRAVVRSLAELADLAGVPLGAATRLDAPATPEALQRQGREVKKASSRAQPAASPAGSPASAQLS